MAFSSETRTSKSGSSYQTADAIENDRLKVLLDREKLKKAIEDAKGRGTGGSGPVGLTADQKADKDRAYQAEENSKAFDRQRQLAADRAGAESSAKADETANLIRLRREASSRGLGVRRALSRSSRG